MSKKSFAAAAKAAMGKSAAKAGKGKAATKALLNAQKVDATVSTDECGNIAIRKSSWNDTQVIADHPKVISGRMVCSGGDFGDQLDFKPYAQTGEKKYTEIIHTLHGALRTSPQRVFISFSFPKEMHKVDIMKYLYKEILELKAKVKHFREDFAWEDYK